MIVRNGIIQGACLTGVVWVDSLSSRYLESLFFGASSKPSWEQLRALGALRFSSLANPAKQRPFAYEYSRDFGDSLFQGASGCDALTSISLTNKPVANFHTPLAMGFAFAQQWARNGHATVHGALLKVEGQGVLVIGSRAAGKSVLSATALAAGGGIITDDYFLLGIDNSVILGERIRRFLSLRRSWAADSLIDRSATEWTPGQCGRRLYLRVMTNSDRFPECSRIDRIWLLKRPRAGRRDHSSLEKISQGETYAAMVSAIQPLLLGNDFPHESAKLQALLGRLISSVPAARIETGQDIVREPKQTWDRLLACSP